MAGSMCQWHEHFFLAGSHTVHVFAHDSVAPGIAVLVTQAFTDADRRVALFHMHLFIGFQDGVNDADKWRQRGRNGSLRSPIAGWHCKLAHLPDRLAMDAEIARHLAFAPVLDHHCTPYLHV